MKYILVLFLVLIVFKYAAGILRDIQKKNDLLNEMDHIDD